MFQNTLSCRDFKHLLYSLNSLSNSGIDAHKNIHTRAKISKEKSGKLNSQNLI